MKKLHAFKRNRYFTGKLLSVWDFQVEQEYFNDKRWMLNRLQHGPGVLSGLEVALNNNKEVCVKPGVAIDRYGREIVIPKQATVSVEGLNGESFHPPYAYLCLSYTETVVKNQRGFCVDGEHQDGRIEEQYNLFWETKPPVPEDVALHDELYRTFVLLDDEKIGRVVQVMPRYVQSGQSFEVAVIVELNFDPGEKSVQLDYQLKDDTLKAFQMKQEGPVSFRRLKNETVALQYVYQLQVLEMTQEKDVVFGIETVTVRIGDTTSTKGSLSTDTVKVVKDFESAKTDFEKNYHDNQVKPVQTESKLHLARVQFEKTGSNGVELKGITPLPHSDLANAPSVSDLLKKLKALLTPVETLTKAGISPGTKGERTATGVVTIQVRGIGQRTLQHEQTFVSDEIDHGLGPGPVYIMTGLADSSESPRLLVQQAEEFVYYGDEDVFRETAYEPSRLSVSIGTRVEPNKGTFRIGIRLPLGPTPHIQFIKVRWWAFQGAPDPF